MTKKVVVVTVILVSSTVKVPELVAATEIKSYAAVGSRGARAASCEAAESHHHRGIQLS